MKYYIAGFWLFTIMLSTIRIVAQEQVNEGGFEDWEGSPAHPKGWVTQQSASGIKGNLELQDVTTSRSGISSMKLYTDTVTLPIIGNRLINGFALYGSGIYKAPATIIYKGTPFTSRPDSLVFWYKFSPVLNDSGSFGIQLTKWSDSAQYVAVNAGWAPAHLLNTYGLWQRNSCPLQYFTSDKPDSMMIGFGSAADVKHQGTALWIDDVSLIYSNSVGVIDNDKMTIAVQLFPNPAITTLHLSSLDLNTNYCAEIFDLKGNILLRDEVKNGSLDVSKLDNGKYILQLHDPCGKQHSGTFIVAR